MKHKKLNRLCYGSALGTLISALSIAGIPTGLMRVRAEAIADQALTTEDIEQLAKKKKQLERDGNYAEAATITEKLVRHFEPLFQDHKNLAGLINNLAALYDNQGLYDKAEPLYQRALTIYEKALGPDHPSTATILNNLAELYRVQRLYSKAEPLYQRSLAIYEKALGPNHPDTALGLNNLASLYSDQGLYSKAEPFYQRSLEIKEKSLGSYHTETSLALNNLASLYRTQGLYSKAEPLYQRALAIDEKVLGPDHHDTAITLNNLANLYNDQGLYSKAEPLYQRSLRINKKALGPDHPSTALSLNNLAILYNNQGLYSKAEPLYQRSLTINEKALGPDHPSTALSLNNLALLYNNQGFYSKAEPLYQRSLAIRKKVLGSDHPDTTINLNNLAALYVNQGLYSKAEPLFQRSLAIRKKALGPDHPDTANSLNSLALLYSNQGLYSKAEPLYQRSLAIKEKTLGPDHTSTALSLNNLATLYHNQGLYEKAEPFYQRALAINEKALGPDHTSTALSLNNLAALYKNRGLYSKAEPLYQRSLKINEKALGPDHPSTALSLNNLALLYNDQGLYSKVEPLLQRTLSIYEKTLGPDHPSTALSINNLAELYRVQSLYSKAEPLYQRSLAIRKKALGNDHSDTGVSLSNLAFLYISQGLYNKAEPLLRHKLNVETRLIQREAPLLVRSDRQAFLTTFGGTQEAVFTSASQNTDMTNLALFSRLNRQGLLQEIEKRQAQLASFPGDQQQVASELRALTQQLSSLSITPQQRQTLKARQQILERELYRLLPQLKPRIVEVEQVAASLPADGVLIEFQRYQPFDGKKPKDERWGEPRYLAMVLKPDRTVTVVQLGDAAPLEKTIASAVSTARQQQDDAPQQFAALSERLLEPLAQATAGATTWFVSPDGELNRLPFAALTAPGGKGYLAEAVDLRLLTTGRELLDLQKPTPAPKQSALVVADPAYDRNGRGNRSAVIVNTQNATSDSRLRSSDLSGQLRWEPLPATAQEGEAIKAITGGELLVQQQATAEAVKRAPTPNVLHLATHAFYLPDQPEQASDPGAGPGADIKTLQRESPMLRSGIALAGANQPNANPNDDGYLTALEVAQLDWDGTDLVVISACESGLGDLQVGEGVYGLKRAIAVAGARSSLLTLWKVDDDATRLFMESFYKRLKQGVGKAAALAATQKQFRDSPELSAYSHPYYWAAFQLSGDWGPVKGL